MYMVQNTVKGEGLFVMLLSVYLFNTLDVSWLVFVLLILSPDIFMVGYLKNKKLGAQLYNIGHSYITSVILIMVGLVFNYQLITAIGIIFSAHTGLDRFLGFGLKYETHFKETHIQKL